MDIIIKYHAPITKLSMIEKGDWCDLRSAQTVEYKQFESFKILLGVSMKLPDGYEAHVAPRSSTFSTWGVILTNSVGVIDESYCGNNDIWKAQFFPTRDGVINFDDRILQFRIIKKQERLNFIETNMMLDEDRGGDGTTGKA